MIKFSFYILAASLVALVQASNVAELNPDNFDSTLAGKPALVELCVLTSVSCHLFTLTIT
jgi:hypothetical protein